MKTFILSFLLALACVTGLSASAPPPDDGSDAVSYCIVDDVADCTQINFLPVFAAPLPLPCVLEVATIPGDCCLVCSNLEDFKTAHECTHRLQGNPTGNEDTKNYYSTTGTATTYGTTSCGGLARSCSHNA